MTTADDYLNDLFKKSGKGLVAENAKSNALDRRSDIGLEMNRRLVEEIKNFNDNSSKQTAEMLKLNRVIMYLTYIMGLLAVVQLFIQKELIYKWLALGMGILLVYVAFKLMGQEKGQKID